MALLVSSSSDPCQCGGTATCKQVSPTYSNSSANPGKTYTTQGTPQNALVNPGVSNITLIVDNKDVGQGRAGLMVTNSFSGHDFDPFDWRYTLVYDGTTILTESGHFPGGSTVPYGYAFLPF